MVSLVSVLLGPACGPEDAQLEDFGVVEDALTSRSFVAVADAEVFQGTPGRNYGETSDVGADGSPQRQAFFRFTVSGLTAPVTKATFRCFVKNPSKDGPRIFKTSGDWSESGLTWANRPATTFGYANSSTVHSGAFVSFDVTGAVAGNGEVNFSLVAETGDALVCLSRETANPSQRPQLVLQVADAPVSSGWVLDFSDDFDTLDARRWNVKNDTYASNEDSYLLAANTSVSNGVLRIQAKKQAYRGRMFTSGYVETNGKYAAPAVFRAEVRAKVPLEYGMWAAPLWFRPADGSGGEIDLVETWGTDVARFGAAKIHHTLHTDYGAAHQQSAVTRDFASEPLGWHTYVIEKTPGRIEMFVDGAKTVSWTSGNPAWFDRYFEARKTWNLRVNLQVGGSTGQPNASTDWAPDRTAMLVDSIKVWRRP